MRSRFTLTHPPTATSVDIAEPGGWSKSKLKLERDEEFHSLKESYDGGDGGALLFYGDDDGVPGGIDFIKIKEASHGFNTNITLLQELAQDDVNFETLFEGKLKLSTLEEDDDNTLKCGIIRDDFWAKFKNRYDTPVNISSSVSIDGDSVAAASSITVNLPSQKVRAKFKRTTGYNAANEGLFSFDQVLLSGGTGYLIFDNGRHDLDEIEERFEYGTQISTIDPTTVKKFIFQTKYAGDYRIQASVRYNLIFGASSNVSVQWKLSYKVNDTLTTVNIGTATGGTGVTTHTDGTPRVIDTTITLPASAEVYVYGVLTLNINTTVTYLPDYDSDSGAGFTDVYTSFEVTADTVYPDTTAEGYTVHELLKSILVHMGLGSDPFYSDFFSLPSGCGAKFVVLKGLQIRGYTISEKPFFISFKDAWEGVNPIFNLGLGYEVISSVQKIRMEEKDHFYDDSSTSVDFDFVRLKRRYDDKRIFKTFRVGFTQWEAGDISGIDDPQTKHVYSSIFVDSGTDLIIESTFIAASLAIETVRRIKRVKKTEDHKYDNKNFIIAVSNTSSPFDPELDENYEGTTNLLNEATRYNKILTPKRMLYRWASYFLGCFQSYLSDRLRFESGEGNYDCITDLDDGTNICLGIVEYCDEGGDFYLDGFSPPGLSATDPGNNYLHLPDLFEMTIPMAWDDYKLMRDNRKKAIGISQTDTGHAKFLVKDCEYDYLAGEASILAWSKTTFNIQVVEDDIEMTCD